MKLTDIAKGLFKKLTAPKPPKITPQHRQHTAQPDETRLHKAPAQPTGRPQRTPRTTAPEPQKRSRPAQSTPAPKTRIATPDEYIHKGRAKRPFPQGERKVSQDNPVKKQIKRFWEKLKPSEKAKKEYEPKQRPGRPRKQAPAPAQPAQPKHRGRPLGAKDKQPRKPRAPKAPTTLPTPTGLASDEQEPANAVFNIIAWLEEQAAMAFNVNTVGYIMSLIYDVINEIGEEEFCRRVTLSAIESDTYITFEDSDGDRVFYSAMTLASIIGLNISEDRLIECITEGDQLRVSFFSLKNSEFW